MDLPILPKWKYFVWRLLLDHLQTKEQLNKRRVPVTPFCDICHEDLETSSHIFQACPLAQSAWHLFSSPIQVLQSNSISCSDWVTNYILLFYSDDGLRGTKIKNFIWTLWSIWLHINERLFRNVQPEVSRISQNLQDIIAMDSHLATFP